MLLFDDALSYHWWAFIVPYSYLLLHGELPTPFVHLAIPRIFVIGESNEAAGETSLKPELNKIEDIHSPGKLMFYFYLFFQIRGKVNNCQQDIGLAGRSGRPATCLRTGSPNPVPYIFAGLGGVRDKGPVHPMGPVDPARMNRPVRGIP
ncbi:hypothetical protein H5410_035840 [Solanum commersonii]|uniref:Uncharacterized protein n=1 Tax=Solanum commersonii TaxID=4109 RepID=A0A9J5Y4U1_SOLCO|nr:hypothetical protein H5410_035840 [Solanum commersonii]